MSVSYYGAETELRLVDLLDGTVYALSDKLIEKKTYAGSPDRAELLLKHLPLFDCLIYRLQSRHIGNLQFHTRSDVYPKGAK